MKPKLTIVFFFLFYVMAAWAQGTMSDDQILQYVVTRNENGASQQQIAKELLEKGVSAAQLQRVRQKAEQMRKSTAM